MKAPVFFLAALALSMAQAEPTAEITSCTVADDVMTVTYTLADGPAVVTFDVRTNVTGEVWASIGGEPVVSGVLAGGDVWKKVSGEGPFTIKWRTDAWKGNAASVRAVVTAWPLDNPPDYMVADISACAKPNTQRYYPGADFVPGGVLGDVRYRQTSLLMRKVMAKGVTWTTGTSSSTTTVTLDDNYYMCVFEATKAQWGLIMGSYPASGGGYFAFTNLAYREMRPIELASYNEIRTSGSASTYNAANDAPNSPHGSSFLGKVRTRTGLDFDLPTLAQWEYACRAGHGEGFWGDGTPDTAAPPGRYTGNGGSNGSDATTDYNCDPTRGTAICGSYPPNSWGIYDMHGNVYEFCTDTKSASPTNPQKYKVGGSWRHGTSNAKASARNQEGAATQYNANGFRVMCPVVVP